VCVRVCVCVCVRQLMVPGGRTSLQPNCELLVPPKKSRHDHLSLVLACTDTDGRSTGVGKYFGMSHRQHLILIKSQRRLYVTRAGHLPPPQTHDTRKSPTRTSAPAI